MPRKAKEVAREAVELAAPPEPVPPKVREAGGLVRVELTLQGVSPLLMNAMGMDKLLAIRDGAKPARTAAKPTLHEEAESRLHRLPSGQPCIPPKALYASFINAGQFVRLDGKRQVSTADKTLLPGMMTLEDTQIPLWKHGGREPAVWEVDVQQGRNPNGGEAVCLVRPRIDEWEFSITLEIDLGEMPLSMARELVEKAGKRIGLLDFRPQRRGTFGRFAITRWQPLEARRAA